MFYVHSYIWYHPADDDHWLAAASELVYGKPGNEVVSRRDGHQPFSRAVRRRALGLSTGTGGRGPRHHDRRRLPVRPGRRRPELEQLSASSHDRLRAVVSEISARGSATLGT